jgi:hypothetical protein
MADEIIVKYRADISALQADFDTIKKESNNLVNNINANQPKFEIKNVNELKKALVDIGKQSGEVLNLDEFSKSIDSAVKDSKKLSQIKAEMEKVALSVDQTTNEYRQLQAVIGGIDNELANLSKQSKQASSDIKGGFSEAFGSLKDGFDLFKSGDLVGSFNAIKAGIGGMTSASLAFIATPVGAAIAALAAIGFATKEWFEFNMEVSKLNGEVEQLTGTTGEMANELRKNATAISNTFGKEFSEAIIEQDNLMKEFGLTSKEAFDVYTKGLARGGARNGEFGDSIREYGVFFKKAGFSAEEFLNVINTGIDLQIYSDKLPDAIKEFGLRISEGTKPAEDALINAFGANFTQKILGGVKSGTLSVKESLTAVAKEAQRAGLNTQQLAQLTADLGGGPAEDLGGIEALFKAINQSQELATKGLTDYEKAMVSSAQRAKDLEDAKDRAFKSDTAIAFIKTLETLWVDLQITFFETIAKLRPVFEFIASALETVFLNIKTSFSVLTSVLSGDFKSAIDTIKGYFTSLNFIWDGVIDKMVLKITQGLLYIAKKIKPVFDVLGISTDSLIKSLEASITRSTNNISKIQKQKADILAKTKAENKAEEEKAKKAQQKPTASSGGGGAKGGKKIDYKKEAEKAEKEYNDAKLKERDAALKKVSDLEVRKQKELIAKLEATGANKNQIEEEKIKLLEAEQKYNNQILAIRGSFANQLADNYTETKQKELEAVIEGNKKIREEETKIANERTKLEINQAISQPDTQTANLEKLKKQLSDVTGLTVEEANKRKIELLKIDEQILLSKMQNNDKEIQALLMASADYNGQLVQDRLKANEDLNQKLIDANKARLNEEEKQEKEAADKRKALFKSQLDELFAFASSGILLQIGIDPQALAKVKGDIEGAIKTFNNPDATDWQKASAVAGAATSTVLAGVDMLRASEQAASEERIAQLNTEMEAELLAAGENEQKKALIKQKYDQKVKAEKRKQFEAEKRASILRVIMTTAEAVIKAVAASPTTGGLPFSAIAAAIGAAQIAMISSQPTPKFKDGVVGFNGIVGGVGTGRSDSNLAWLSKGESVIPAEATGRNLGLVTSLVNGDVDKYLKNHYILPAIEAKEAEVMQISQKRMDDIESKIINRTIAKTLDAMRKDNKVNTSEIVTAIKKDKFTL